MANSQFNQSNESKDDAMPTYLPPGVAKIVTNLLNGNIDTNFTGDKDTKPFSTEERQQFTLFKKPLSTLIERAMHSDQDAAVIGNLILRGEEKDVDDALTLLATKLQEDPCYLEYTVIAADPLKRPVKGTLLQIAAMAGDWNLIPDIKEEKKHGLVERIAKVGKLSNEDVVLQLQVITSKEAQEANEKRNQRILDAITKFGKGLLQKADEYKGELSNDNDDPDINEANFKKFQTFCKSVIDELEKALTPNTEEIITSGFIFDPAILFQAAKWTEENISGGGWGIQSEIFWVNGVGKLQNKLSSRDAQITNAGIGFLTSEKEKIVPPRTLNCVNRANGSSFFYNSTSGLGKDIYLGHFGKPCSDTRRWRGKYGDGRPSAHTLKIFVEQKQQVLQIYANNIRQNRFGA